MTQGDRTQTRLASGWRRMAVWLPATAALLACAVQAQAPQTQPAGGAKQVMLAVIANEDVAAHNRDRFAYLSRERSERTGGHEWTERVVETTAGKVRFLIAEDGQPLAPERVAQERGRLAEIANDPEAFARREQAQKDDENHAKQMLSALPRAFTLGPVHEQDGELVFDYSPNPGYAPQSMEERVLHGMSGEVWIDAKSLRLHRVNGRLPEDVSIGFGLLATIRAGSNFDTERNPFDGGEWKTTRISTEINGKAIFFKAIARRQHTERSEFARVPNDISVAQAVARVEE